MFVLNELFRNKADPNIQGKDGRTVLHDAVATGKGYDVCTRLLEAGARFDIRDANQQTAMDLAMADENYEQQDAIRTGIMKQDRRIAASMAMDAYVPRELHSTITNSIPHRMF
jgi:ankyrin repeat protein